jgi:hypothetical protein
MVEAAGVFVFPFGAAHHNAFARLARAHQMHGGGKSSGGRSPFSKPSTSQ